MKFHVRDFARMPKRSADPFEGGGVPQVGAAIAAGRCDHLAARTECDSIDIHVMREGVQQLRFGYTPEFGLTFKLLGPGQQKTRAVGMRRRLSMLMTKLKKQWQGCWP
jgi:hypothetical protein